MPDYSELREEESARADARAAAYAARYAARANEYAQWLAARPVAGTRALSARQIATVRDLRAGMQLHSGRIAGTCAEWQVEQVRGQVAYLRLAGTIVRATGGEIRAAGMFPADACPLCEWARRMPAPMPPPAVHAAGKLRAAGAPSALRRVTQPRLGTGRKYGGGFLRPGDGSRELPPPTV